MPDKVSGFREDRGHRKSYIATETVGTRCQLSLEHDALKNLEFESRSWKPLQMPPLPTFIPGLRTCLMNVLLSPCCHVEVVSYLPFACCSTVS